MQNAQIELMSAWNPKRDPEPDRRDAFKFKEFIKQKYEEKRFSIATKGDSEDSEDEEKLRAKK